MIPAAAVAAASSEWICLVWIWSGSAVAAAAACRRKAVSRMGFEPSACWLWWHS